MGYFNSPVIDRLEEGTNATAFSVSSKRHYNVTRVWQSRVREIGKVSKRHQGSPWELHKDDVRRQILDVEMKLFDNDGSHPITAGTGQ